MSLSRRTVLWGPVIAAMAAIFVVSSQQDAPLPDGLNDKQGHGLAYATLGGLVTRAIVGGIGAPVSLPAAAAAVGLTTAYGASDEWHQSFVDGRVADVRDLGADATGALVGTAACWLWGIIRPRSDV